MCDWHVYNKLLLTYLLKDASKKVGSCSRQTIPTSYNAITENAEMIIRITVMCSPLRSIYRSCAVLGGFAGRHLQSRQVLCGLYGGSLRRCIPVLTTDQAMYRSALDGIPIRPTLYIDIIITTVFIVYKILTWLRQSTSCRLLRQNCEMLCEVLRSIRGRNQSKIRPTLNDPIIYYTNPPPT